MSAQPLQLPPLLPPLPPPPPPPPSHCHRHQRPLLTILHWMPVVVVRHPRPAVLPVVVASPSVMPSRVEAEAKGFVCGSDRLVFWLAGWLIECVHVCVYVYVYA